MAARPLSIVICLRKLDEPKGYVRSVLRECIECRWPVWISTATLWRAESMQSYFLCIPCVSTVSQGRINAGPMSAGQIHEIKTFYAGQLKSSN